MKFVCLKMKWEYNREAKTKRRVCHCENPCTTSSCGRMIYIYPEKNLRAYPVWNETLQNGLQPTRSVQTSKNQHTISKTASVLLSVNLKIKRHYIRTFCLPVSLNWLQSWSLIKYISLNTSEV